MARPWNCTDARQIVGAATTIGWDKEGKMAKKILARSVSIATLAAVASWGATSVAAARTYQGGLRSTAGTGTFASPQAATAQTTTTIGNISAGHGQSVTLWDGITGSNEPSFLSWLRSTTAPVKLQAEELPWSVIYEKLPSAMASGQPPQMMMLHPYDLVPYQQHKDLVPLNSFVASFEPKSVLDSTVWKANSLDGTQYAAPVGVWDGLFFYNKTLWDKAGYPQGPPLDNPAKLMAALKELTVRHGSRTVQWGFGTDDDADDIGYLYEMLMMQAGEAPFTSSSVRFDSPQSLKVLNFMQGLVNTEHIEAPLSGLNSEALFEQGKLALWFSGQWQIEGLQQYTASGGKLKWGVTSKPVVMMSGGKQITLEGGPSLAISKATGESSKGLLSAEEKFLKWAVTTEAHWVSGGGLLPVSASTSEQELIRKSSAANYTAYQQLKLGEAEPTNPNYDSIDGQVLLPMLEKLDEGGSSAKNLASSAQSQAASVAGS